MKRISSLSTLAKWAMLCACLVVAVATTVPAFAAPVSVPVRAGIHDRFNRVVLDWPVQVKYSMSQGNGLVTIQFDQAATLGLGGFRSASPPYIQNLSYNNNSKGLELSFRIPDKSRVQAFWSGKSVAFDVLLMTQDKPAFKDDKKVADKPKADTKAAADQKKTKKDKKPAAPVETTTTGPQKPVVLPTQAAPKDTAGKAPAPQNPFMNIETLADRMNREAAAAQNPPPAALKPAASSDSDNEDIDGTAIAFRSLTKMSAAVFTRAGRLWVVFDQSPPNLKPDISGVQADALKGVVQQQSGASTAFIFDLPQDIDPKGISIKQDGLNWVITLSDTANDFVQSLSHVSLTSDDAKSLMLMTGQTSQVFTFKDDIVGDKLWVVPVRSPMVNSIVTQDLPAVTLLPTILGGLLLPQQDSLKVRTDKNQVFVESLSGSVLMSALTDRVRAQQKPQEKKIFLLETASIPPHIKTPEDQRKYVEKRISKSKDKSDKALQALELARVYLAQGYGSEAEGALDLAVSYVPNLSQTPAFLALEGMAQALGGTAQDALTTLNGSELDDMPVTELWRGYAYAQQKDWERAFLAFRAQQNQIADYPPAVVTRLSLAAAESAVSTDNFGDAQTFLRPLERGIRLNSGQQAARDYMQAKIWLDGSDSNKSKAEALLQDLADGNDRYYRVKATMDVTALKLERKAITPDDAINALEKLRYAWRGDRQETQILQELGHYYLENKNPMQAMTMWQQAYALAQNEADKKALDKTLHKEFDRLFVEGQSKGMAPLQALSLYQRFRDLMPQDEDGAKAAMQLAEQLLSVDLVDEAGSLLQDQIDKQSAPDQMMAMGTKLAAIRLIARNPEAAIKALDASEQADVVPDDIEKRRMLLRARALADMQQTDQALVLLANPSVPEGLSLRADIFWRLSRWSDAAYDLQGLIDDISDKTAKNPVYTNLILRLAIVKAMQNDQMGLNQLSAQYGEMMATSKQGKAFQIMTSELGDTTLSDLETLKSQVADAELFEKFLQDF